MFKSKQGISMVEMMVAITIIATGLIGMLGLINRSLGIQRVTSEQYTATYLAAEGIEVMKNFFDYSYVIAKDDDPGSNNFYGSTEPSAGSPYYIEPGIYQVEYNSDVFPRSTNAISCSLPASGKPDQKTLESIFSTCGDIDFLNFDTNTNLFSYGSGSASKFRRIIVVDIPQEYGGLGVGLNYRITSAVQWNSRGGDFMIHLEDHFLPYRTP